MRWSERGWLSQIVLRAARSAPATASLSLGVGLNSMNTRLLVLLASLLCAISCSGHRKLTLDTPIHFSSGDDVLILSGSPPHDVHPAIGEALTYLTAHVRKDGASHEENGALILALCNGRTPRELMIFGFVLHLEVMKRAVCEDQLRIATRQPLREGETFEDSQTLYLIRISRGHAEINAAQEQIDGLLKRSPTMR